MDLPNHLQVDTYDLCNLNCVYCCAHNPSHEPTQMPLHTVEKIASQIGDWPLASIRPFSRGDPLFETRMPEIVRIIRKYSQAPIYLSTNGTVCGNKHLLVNRDIQYVNFTISAATPETYHRICGKPLLHQAMRTLEWFSRNKAPSQQISISFIPNSLNEHELELWRQKFRDYGQVVSWMHRLNRNMKLVDPIFPKGSVASTYGSPNLLASPCNLWNNMGINTHGDILQCCGGDDNQTYGNVADTPLIEAWRRRCENNLRNPLCQSCNYRVQDLK